MMHDYADWLGVHVSRRNFKRELDQLPGEYAPPDGVLLVSDVGDVIAGCIGLRRLDETTGELKRLYIRPEYRGRGLGRQLAIAAIAAARKAGYSRIRLDTVPGQDSAECLYTSLGFIDIPPYYDNPRHAVRFMQLDLSEK